MKTIALAPAAELRRAAKASDIKYADLDQSTPYMRLTAAQICGLLTALSMVRLLRDLAARDGRE
jgi:hypothetical protein